MLAQTIEQNGATLVIQNSDPKENENSDSKFIHGGDINAYFARKIEEKKKAKESKDIVSNDSKENDMPNVKEEKVKKKEKKAKKTKQNKDNDDLLGFQGTNILSIKGYGIKSK